MKKRQLGLAAAAALFALPLTAKAQFGYFNSRPTIGYGSVLPMVGNAGNNYAAQGYRLSPLDLQAMRVGGYGAVGKGYNPIVTDPRTPHWLANPIVTDPRTPHWLTNPVVPASNTRKAQAVTANANSGRVLPGRSLVPLNTPVWLATGAAKAPNGYGGLGQTQWFGGAARAANPFSAQSTFTRTTTVGKASPAVITR